MNISCIWEHNGSDTLLWCETLPGVCARGAGLEEAREKLPGEVCRFLRWMGGEVPAQLTFTIAQDCPCDLAVRDADSDVLFSSEKAPLTLPEYWTLRDRCLKSAADFQSLYDSIPDKSRIFLPRRSTFYGDVPRTAEEMYQHTKNVNEYYFAEIEVAADNTGTIGDCRRRAFARLEASPDFWKNPLFHGSYGENWTLRKVLRRFLWHDRIHAKAMYRRAAAIWGQEVIADPFCF